VHIPENYLSPSTCGAMGVVMIPVWVHAAREVRRTVPREKMQLLGVAAAFCFLAMMFNVPVPGGTTGHAVCGTLVAILFGPWAAVISISVAVVVQALFFGDGGVLAIGANCFNMAFVLPFVGFGAYRLVCGLAKHDGSARELVAAGVGSYLGINAAALCAAIELGVQPLLFSDAAGNALYCPYPLWVSIPTMLAAHLTVCGAAEIVFTVGILAFVRRVTPSFGLSDMTGQQGQGNVEKESLFPVGALLASLIAVCPLGLLAAGDAWGEWAADDLGEMVGYVPSGMSGGWEWTALFPDYTFGALPDWVGYILSAVIGVALLVIVFRLVAAAVKPKAQFV
jgi:cobalt/nickel transport system permease protein